MKKNKMDSISKLRGTKDMIGSEVRVCEMIEDSAGQLFSQYGYIPLRTPIIEETQLFQRSVGEVTDIVQKEMYSFTDRSDLNICLRPEGTAGVVRAFIENRLDKDKATSKLYYLGPMFRAERPQAGRLRQFHQLGAECFGSNSLLADVEVIEMAARLLESLEITDYKIMLNNLGLENDRKKFIQEMKQYFKDKKSSLCEDCQLRLSRNVLRMLDCKKGSCQPVLKKAPEISAFVSAESRRHFEDIVMMLDQLGLPYEVNPRIVRGLDYHTETVFEITHPLLGSQDAVGAGGRYSGLVSKLGGNDIPGVGFAMGIERLLIILKKMHDAPDEEGVKEESVYTVALGDDAKKHGYIVTSNLRSQGFDATIDFDDRSLKAALRAANKSGSRFVIIIGESELQKGTVILKDMSDSGDGSQLEVDEQDLANALSKRMKVDEEDVTNA